MLVGPLKPIPYQISILKYSTKNLCHRSVACINKLFWLTSFCSSSSTPPKMRASVCVKARRNSAAALCTEVAEGEGGWITTPQRVKMLTRELPGHWNPWPSGPNSSEGLTRTEQAPCAPRSSGTGSLILPEKKPFLVFMQFQDCVGLKIHSWTPSFHEVHFEDLGSF